MRNWDALAAGTQHRYERAGVSRSHYEAGVSLKAARGHAETPERPSVAARHPERYESYVGLRTHVRNLKIELYGADKVVGNAGIYKSASRAHLNKVAEILTAKLDYQGNWSQFWDDHPEYDRDAYADVEKYH